VRLTREPLDTGLSPQDVLRALRGDRMPFLLAGEWAGGGAVAGSEPIRVAEPGEDPFALVDQPEVDGPEGAVGGGWFGWLGFALGGMVERLPPAPPRPVPLPSAGLGFYDHVLRLDERGRWWFEALVTPAREAHLRRRRDELAARLAVAPERRPWRLRGMSARGPGYDGHRWAVADAVDRIAAGELFQANLCLRLEGRLDGDPLDAFADVSPDLRAPYGAFLWGSVLSFSPELFLRRTGRTAVTAPIKGTAPRPAGAAAAAASRAALAASAKDAAEHVMIVDLMRNDLGRVARHGTVAADPVPSVEAHPGVWHLVSRVRAELREGASDGDLLRAAFPPGSVTGAPKVQSLHVISALEATAREVYTGAIGYASPVAGLELSVAIRTFETSGGHVWLGCGGGVVADSDADAELREALGKARPLVAALGGSVPGPAPVPRRPELPARRLARRPDPALGVFETIAVDDGEPVALDAHLERLAAALGGTLPTGLEARVAAAAGAAGPGRHRLRVVVEEGVAEVACAPAAASVDPIRLEPVLVPGGLGERKWADRAPLAELERPGVLGLVVDADGAVLEATAANVWIAERGRLVTPPADGRLLPGVTRARLLADPGLATAEERIDLARLRAADAVLVTSAIRLVAPASAGAGELAASLRARL
jgi:para-aminobenzoate synthetase/4-amino-4-deoxychorismate lyase